MTPGPEDIALVLPGGGAWIYAQAAALKVLFSDGTLAPKIKGIYCNSAGSISGACLAAGLHAGIGTDLLEKALGSVSINTQIYTPDVMPVIEHPALHPLTIAEVGNGVIFGQSGLNQQPLWDLLKQYLGQLTSDDIMSNCGIEILVRGFASEAGVGHVYNGLLWRMAAASSAIEVAFRAHLGVSDGGPVDNSPADIPLDRGFKKILICYCGSEGPLPDFTPVRLDDSTPEPTGISAREIAFSLLGNLTQINEGLTEERLKLFVAGGGQLVEAYPAQGSAMGSILDFTTAAQAPRVAAGEAAGKLALADAKAKGWV